MDVSDLLLRSLLFVSTSNPLRERRSDDKKKRERHNKLHYTIEFDFIYSFVLDRLAMSSVKDIIAEDMFVTIPKGGGQCIERKYS